MLFSRKRSGGEGNFSLGNGGRDKGQQRSSVLSQSNHFLKVTSQPKAISFNYA